MHMYYYVNVFNIIYLCIVCFADAINKSVTVLNYYIFVLLAAALAGAVFGTVIAAFTSIYASL